MRSLRSASPSASLVQAMTRVSRFSTSRASRISSFWARLKSGEYPERSARCPGARASRRNWMAPLAPRISSRLSTSARYSRANSTTASEGVSSSGAGSTCTQSAPPTSACPAPRRARYCPVRIETSAPVGSLPDSCTRATVPMLPNSPSMRGTSRTRRLPWLAASIAARWASPWTATVTVMWGRTTTSSRGRIGRSSALCSVIGTFVPARQDPTPPASAPRLADGLRHCRSPPEAALTPLNQDCGPPDPTRPDQFQGPVPLGQGEHFGQDLDPHLPRQRHELGAVLPREIRHGAERALPPEQRVGETGDVAHMDAGADHGAPGSHRLQRERNQFAGRGEDDRGVEWRGSRAGAVPRPRRPQAAGNLLAGEIPGPREGVHGGITVAGHPPDQVRGAAEAVQPQPRSMARHPERSEADETGAEQRRRLDVRGPAGQAEAEAGVGQGELGETTVDITAREAGRGAEVLATGGTHLAASAGRAQPRQAHPLSYLQDGLRAGRHHPAHHLMPEHDGEETAVQLAVHDVEICAADGAGRHPQPHLVSRGLGHATLLHGERSASLAQNHRPIGGGAHFRHQRR